MRHEWKLLLVFCGIPGAGKSTLARKLQQEAKIVGHSAHIVEFDTFYNDYNDNNFDPVEWKVGFSFFLSSFRRHWLVFCSESDEELLHMSAEITERCARICTIFSRQ